MSQVIATTPRSSSHVRAGAPDGTVARWNNVRPPNHACTVWLSSSRSVISSDDPGATTCTLGTNEIHASSIRAWRAAAAAAAGSRSNSSAVR